ncbi:proteasome core particle subunit beta 2 [Chytridiales sp. JEL 0842]|nr:proteasome core particle subunit beta 2 [Chytridiales sp. JEL 0842]
MSNLQVMQLQEKLKRRQVVGSYRSSVETAKVLAIVVRGTRWQNKDELLEIVKEKGRQLIAAQPIELAVGNIVRRVLNLIREEEYTISAEGGSEMTASERKDLLKHNVIDAIREMIDELENSSSNIAGQALEHIHSNEIIMTLGKSIAVEKFLKEAAKLRKFQVIVAETAPSYAGQEMALALSQAGIDTTLISDSAIFAVMSRVNKVILGTHAVLANGGLVAINGSSVVATAAKHHSTPVVILTELYKLSPVYPFDTDAFSLQLSPSAVYGFEDGDMIDKIDVLNPSFDFVVPDLVSLFITNINVLIENKGMKPPKATKTGTTIVGCIYKDGLVLGADTRATEGPIVADKNCEKIHYLAPNMYCCGAGTAADTEFTTALISSKLELHTLSTGRQARVSTAMTMLKQMLFRYQGHIGAALVLGGFDVNGPQLYTIYPHGSTDKLPYVTMGSGSLNAMAIFESKWKKDMSRDEAVELVKDAIESGIFNDLGSGSNVDVCVIKKDSVEYLRNYRKPNQREPKEQSYKFPRGTTAVLTTDIRKLVDVVEGDAMDTS